MLSRRTSKWFGRKIRSTDRSTISSVGDLGTKIVPGYMSVPVQGISTKFASTSRRRHVNIFTFPLGKKNSIKRIGGKKRFKTRSTAHRRPPPGRMDNNFIIDTFYVMAAVDDEDDRSDKYRQRRVISQTGRSFCLNKRALVTIRCFNDPKRTIEKRF